MPRTFFDQVLVSTPRRRSRPWVTAGSVVLHALALAVIFVLPLTAAFSLPDIQTPLPPMMMAAAMPLPPEPPAVQQQTSPVPQMNPNAAPLTSPDTITPEVPPTPVSTVPPVPGRLPGVSTGAPYTGLLGPKSVGTALPDPPRPPEQPRRVGGDIVPPQRTVYKAPVYPQAAVAARIEGIVILEATIDAQGVVQDVTVLRSLPMLDRAAVEAVRQWRYQPTRLNGQAIPIIMTVTVNFSLR
jgi:protein TonB